MSRSVCLGKSSSGDQRQLAVDVTSAHAEMRKPSDKAGKKAVTDKSCRNLPARALPRPVQVSCKDIQKFPSGEVNTDEHSPKESTNTTPRVEEQVQSAAEADEELEMKDPRTAQPPDLAPADSHPPVEPLPSHEEEEQTEEEDAENENIKAPVELIMEFLRSVMGKDLQLASRLCQMILIFEPDNPEASEFLPLIKKKLLEEQEAEQSTEEEEEDEDDDEDDDNDKDNSESDEESSQSSSCSSSSRSSPSQSDEDEEEEKRGSRHKPCPPSH